MKNANNFCVKEDAKETLDRGADASLKEGMQTQWILHSLDTTFLLFRLHGWHHLVRNVLS